MLTSWKPFGFLVVLMPCAFIGTLATGTPVKKTQPSKVSLSAWRTLDQKGQSCASCHSPDGIEIAAYNFTDEDLLRRATPHIGAAGAQQIVAQVHAIRDEYHITHLLDPMTDRPMQPGGSILEGETAQDRDKEFALSLAKQLPSLFVSRIDSLGAAKAARDQVLHLNLKELKVGIPFNRISEDVFHGPDHATIADWISDVRLSQDIPQQLEDAYLADPSPTTYASLESYLTSAALRPLSPAQEIGLSKKRSLLYFQHGLRMKQLGRVNDVTPAWRNPMWNLGEQGRFYARAKIDALGMPSDIAAKKMAGPSCSDQMKQIRLAWYWLGWIMDPSLQHTSLLAETNRADYFTRFLATDGPYPVHEVFMITRKIAEESFVPSAWIVKVPQHLKINYSGFVNDDGVNVPLPTDNEHQKLFTTLTANSFRMNLYLAIDELTKTKTVYQRLMELQQIRRMKAFFKDPADQALADKLVAEISKAKDGARMGKGT